MKNISTLTRSKLDLMLRLVFKEQQRYDLTESEKELLGILRADKSVQKSLKE